MTLWWRWVAANAVGEGVGLGLAFGIGAWLHAALGEGPTFLVGVLALGTLEGVMLGVLQAAVWRRAVPAIPAGRWVAATALGALVAWALGMLPSTLMDATAGDGPPPAPPSEAVQLAFAALLGALAGPVLAAFQWRVLRRHVDGAWRWIPAHAAAWALAMPLTFVVGGAVPERGVDAPFLAFAVAMLTLTGATAGAVHGVLVVRVAREVAAASVVR